MGVTVSSLVSHSIARLKLIFPVIINQCRMACQDIAKLIFRAMGVALRGPAPRRERDQIGAELC